MSADLEFRARTLATVLGTEVRFGCAYSPRHYNGGHPRMACASPLWIYRSGHPDYRWLIAPESDEEYQTALETSKEVKKAARRPVK